MGKGSLAYFQQAIYSYRCEIVYADKMYIVWKVDRTHYRLEIHDISAKGGVPIRTIWEVFFGNIILQLPQEIKNSEEWYLYEFPF